MSSSTVFSTAILATLLFVSSTMGHSQLRCAKYNTQTGDCYSPIRNEGSSFLEEAYDMTTGGGLCQSAWTNPITASYGGSDSCGYPGCPDPMGTFTPGENFYFQWLARNHAEADQTPGNVTLYLSPAETVNQGMDVTEDVFHQNQLCTAPFMSCGGLNGNFVNCSAPCTMPTNTQPGLYTLWWKWVWPGHTSIYSTCADIWVVASGSNTPTTPSTPTQPLTTGATAPAVPSTTGSKPAPAPTPVTPSTTGAKAVAAPSTTGAEAVAAPSTTGSSATPAPVPSSGSCSAGSMKCLTSETFSMCNFGEWGPSQSCAYGTQCSPSGDYIYCLVPSTPSVPSTPPTTPSTPSTPTVPSTSTSSTASDSSCSTMGYQRCTGSNSYQTCGNGISGPTWSANQLCQSGLSCHASSDSNHIYCY